MDSWGFRLLSVLACVLFITSAEAKPKKTAPANEKKEAAFYSTSTAYTTPLDSYNDPFIIGNTYGTFSSGSYLDSVIQSYREMGQEVEVYDPVLGWRPAGELIKNDDGTVTFRGDYGDYNYDFGLNPKGLEAKNPLDAFLGAVPTNSISPLDEFMNNGSPRSFEGEVDGEIQLYRYTPNQ